MQEYQQENQTSIFDNGQLDVQEKSAVLKLSGNVKIFAILLLVNGVLGLLAYFTTRQEVIVAEGFATSIINSQNNIVATLIGFLLNVLFFYFLYRFSTSSKKAIEGLDQSELNISFNYLGTYFKIIGVLLILGLIIFIFSFLLFGLGRLVA